MARPPRLSPPEAHNGGQAGYPGGFKLDSRLRGSDIHFVTYLQDSSLVLFAWFYILLRRDKLVDEMI
jgi:hypothetical protein